MDICLENSPGFGENDGGVMMRNTVKARLARSRKTGILGAGARPLELPRIEEGLSDSPEILRRLSRHLQVIREKESKGIAREIHDELGQALTALKMDISWLSHKIAEYDGNKDRLLEKMVSMSQLVDKTIQVVQKISAELRPGLLDDLGLVPAIEWLAQEFETRSGIKCKTKLEADDTEISPDCSTAIFRIVQEALTNVARHSQATRVSVRLREKDEKLALTVTDNGVGINRAHILSPESLGIIGMRERLAAFGGELKLKGTPGRGTTLAIQIPVKECKRHD
jgi:two-component system sensor histidine kinase UhpB